jgi:hypothetical protein
MPSERPGLNLPRQHNVPLPVSLCAPDNHLAEKRSIAAAIIEQTQGESAGKHVATCAYHKDRNSGEFAESSVQALRLITLTCPSSLRQVGMQLQQRVGGV